MLYQSVHRSEDRTRLVTLRDAHAEALLDGHRKLQGIKGVKAEPLAEQRHRIVDVRRALPLQVQLRDHELLELLPHFLVVHEHVPARYHSFRPSCQGGSTFSVALVNETAMALVDYASSAGVALLTLNDPPANAYTHEMMKELDAAILKARFDNDVHVIVVTGHGEKFFCAGANIGMLRSSDPTFKYYFCLHANETLSRLEHTPKLCIAALNGHTVGGGLEIALACDLRVARKGTGKIGLPEVALGVLPGTGGTQRLARLVGRSRAIQLMCEGQTFDFEAALACGLINDVWETSTHQAFMERVLDYARGFTPPSRAAMAVGRIKRAVQTGVEMALEQGLALERELQAELFASDDAREGLAAFVEKRSPSFQGK